MRINRSVTRLKQLRTMQTPHSPELVMLFYGLVYLCLRLVSQPLDEIGRNP